MELATLHPPTQPDSRAGHTHTHTHTHTQQSTKEDNALTCREQSREQRAASSEQRAASREQRTESREQRAESARRTSAACAASESWAVFSLSLALKQPGGEARLVNF